MAGKTNTDEVNTQQNTDELIKEAVAKALAEQALAHEQALAEQALAHEQALAAVEAAHASHGPTGTVGTTTEVKMVKIKIARERKDQSDVEVSVNGKVYQIKRGVEVEVPDYIAEVLENTRKMDELRMERIEQATRNF